VLELALQAVYLSANELRLREWIENRRDTMWSQIVDGEDAVFSERFCDAFFPELKSHIKTYGQIARNLYRECSECVHGNTPKLVPLPSTLVFNQDVFDLWHEKSDLVKMVINFALCLRYLSETEEENILKLEPFLMESVGHISEIRAKLGGTVKA
jgi:hypothetical protein